MNKYYFEQKSLEELENSNWNETNFPTGLVTEIFYLRKKKLKDFDANDIRMMIGQNLGLEYLIPMALKILQKDILEDALFYPGDLLSAVLNSKKNYWDGNNSKKEELVTLLEANSHEILSSTIINKEIKMQLLQDIARYIKPPIL